MRFRIPLLWDAWQLSRLKRTCKAMLNSGELTRLKIDYAVRTEDWTRWQRWSRERAIKYLDSVAEALSA